MNCAAKDKKIGIIKGAISLINWTKKRNFITMDFYEKLKAGQTVYLNNEYEQAVVKIIPGDKTYVKIKDKSEFIAHKDSGLVTDAIIDRQEISKSEYDNF